MPDEDEYAVYQTDDGVRHGYGEIVLITDSREQLAQSVAADRRWRVTRSKRSRIPTP